MTEEERAIANLSDAELLIWHDRYGFDRLPRQQMTRLCELLIPELEAMNAGLGESANQRRRRLRRYAAA